MKTLIPICDNVICINYDIYYINKSNQAKPIYYIYQYNLITQSHTKIMKLGKVRMNDMIMNKKNLIICYPEKFSVFKLCEKKSKVKCNKTKQSNIL